MNSSKLYLVNHLVRVLPDTRCFALKRGLYRWCGVSIGQHVRICSSVRIIGGGKLSIGDNTWIGHDFMIVASAGVTIGADVNIAPRSFIGTGTHAIDVDGSASAGRGVSLPVVIEDGAWLCACCTIIAGKRVGRKSIVGAGACVVSDVPPMEVWGGVPARRIKSLEECKGKE